MSQYDFGTIDPFVVDGIALASMLNQWRDALYSMQRGGARPPFAVPGQLWCNDAAGPSNWIVNYYVSPSVGDVPLFSINTTSGAITWRATLLGGPFLPLAGGTVTGDTSFSGALTALGALISQAVAGQPTHIFRADANVANSRIFELLENADGSFSFRAMSDDLTTLQGEAKVNRDGSMAATSPAVAAAGGEVATASWVRALIAAAAAGAPTGQVSPFAGAGAAPAGWLLCDGTPKSRTTFPALFGVIGTTYGVGDGSTTFNVPDLRGRVVFGSDAMGGIAANRLGGGAARPGGIANGTVGQSGGEQSHQLVAAEGANMPVAITGGQVRGTFTPNENDVAPTIPPVGGSGGGLSPQTFLTLIGGTGVTTGGGTGHNTVPPGLVLNYIIKT